MFAAAIGDIRTLGSMNERAMVIRNGMTVGQVITTFAATFPGLHLAFGDASAAYYKEGSYPEYLVAATDIMRSRIDPPTAVTISGAMSAREVRDALYLPFGYEAEIEGLTATDQTLDQNIDPRPGPGPEA